MPDDNTTDVLRRIGVVVSFQGDRVILKVGNVTMGFHYNDALKISQWIRTNAKQAKRQAGDLSRTWSAVAYLEDAEEAYKKGWK